MRFRHLFWFVSLALLAVAGYASSVRPLELEELVRQSHQIFVGRVVATRQGTMPDSHLAYTEYTVSVSDWIKGGSSPTLTFRQLGRSGGALFIPGLPQYRKGDEVLLFIHQPSEIGLTSPVGMQQGYYRVERATNGDRYVRAGSMLPSVVRLSSRARAAQSPAASSAPSDRVSLTDFLTLVRRIQ